MLSSVRLRCSSRSVFFSISSGDKLLPLIGLDDDGLAAGDAAAAVADVVDVVPVGLFRNSLPDGRKRGKSVSRSSLLIPFVASREGERNGLSSDVLLILLSLDSVGSLLPLLLVLVAVGWFLLGVRACIPSIMAMYEKRSCSGVWIKPIRCERISSKIFLTSTLALFPCFSICIINNKSK